MCRGPRGRFKTPLVTCSCLASGRRESSPGLARSNSMSIPNALDVAEAEAGDDNGMRELRYATAVATVWRHLFD